MSDVFKCDKDAEAAHNLMWAINTISNDCTGIGREYCMPCAFSRCLELAQIGRDLTQGELTYSKPTVEEMYEEHKDKFTALVNSDHRASQKASCGGVTIDQAAKNLSSHNE